MMIEEEQKNLEKKWTEQYKKSYCSKCKNSPGLEIFIKYRGTLPCPDPNPRNPKFPSVRYIWNGLPQAEEKCVWKKKNATRT